MAAGTHDDYWIFLKVNNINKNSQKDRPSYKDTLNLLQTNFGMRANASLREPELQDFWTKKKIDFEFCLLYTSPSPRDQRGSRMPSSA